jgi:ABC-2 type transport system ATP-binding protein
LLARGSVEEVIAHSGLVTYIVTGEEPAKLAAELEGKPGVEMVAPFGTSIHISGRDAPALETAIAPYKNDPALVWTRAQPSLEDVFIDLMIQTPDNFQ